MARTASAYYAQQFAKVFGKPLETAWDDWIAWEHEFQAANLQSVRQYPLTQGRRLTQAGTRFSIALLSTTPRPTP